MIEGIKWSTANVMAQARARLSRLRCRLRLLARRSGVHVSVAAIFELYNEDVLTKARALVRSLLRSEPAAEEAETRTALQHAMLTAQVALTADQGDWLSVRRR